MIGKFALWDMDGFGGVLVANRKRRWLAMFRDRQSQLDFILRLEYQAEPWQTAASSPLAIASGPATTFEVQLGHAAAYTD